MVRAFPLSGTAPTVTRWADFEDYYDRLCNLGIIASMKDFYCDIRPKPEYGTVEVRVCDTPLTARHAALLGCYAQLLSRWILDERPFTVDAQFYLLYQYNRFEASRYGLEGKMAELDCNSEKAGTQQTIHFSVLDRLRDLERYTQNDAERQALQQLSKSAYSRINDATWLRKTFQKRGSLNDLMRMSSELWMAGGEESHLREAA